MIIEILPYAQRYTLLGSKPRPEPVAEPVVGTHGYPGDVFRRIIPDSLNPDFNYQSRTLTEKIKIRLTNAMYVPRRWYFREDIQDWRVDQYSKISFWPEDDNDWLAYFLSGMTPWIWERFCTSGFGWRDNKANAILAWLAGVLGITAFGVRPDGVAIYNFLLCTGALIKQERTWKQWTIFTTQDTNKPPEWVTYARAPDRVFKQYLVGNFGQGDTWTVDKGEVGGMGDLYLPTACPGGLAAVQTYETRQVQPLPWSTTMNGYPVTFVEYCFTGSDTYGKDTYGQWYAIEQMEITGDPNDRTKGGTWLDLRRYTDTPVCFAPPAAVIGWQRQ